jgi:hypothetical protein
VRGRIVIEASQYYSRDVRPVGLAYKHLIDIHRHQLGYSDAQSLTDVLEKEMSHA